MRTSIIFATLLSACGSPIRGLPVVAPDTKTVYTTPHPEPIPMPKQGVVDR